MLNRSSGKSTTRIEVISTLQLENKNDAVMPEDIKRKVYLAVHWQYSARLMFETFGPFRIGGRSQTLQKDPDAGSV